MVEELPSDEQAGAAPDCSATRRSGDRPEKKGCQALSSQAGRSFDARPRVSRRQRRSVSCCSANSCSSQAGWSRRCRSSPPRSSSLVAIGALDLGLPDIPFHALTWLPSGGGRPTNRQKSSAWGTENGLRPHPFPGILGTSMATPFTWQGCDSILAVPRVLDLVRLGEVAAGRAQKGVIGFTCQFFPASNR